MSATTVWLKTLLRLEVGASPEPVAKCSVYCAVNVIGRTVLSRLESVFEAVHPLNALK